METVVLVIMILVSFSFLLKLTWHRPLSVIITAIAAALFSGLAWSFAAGQSKTQINGWLEDASLMQDIAVILSIEVIIQIAFCILAAHIEYSGVLKRRTIVTYRILRWFPGLMIFPVMFSILVYLIFSFPGIPFNLISWSMAGGTLVIIPSGVFLLKKTLPEKEIRMETLFLTNAMTAILGIIATVNGRTAVKGVAEVDWTASGSLAAIVVLAAGIGLTGYRIKTKRHILKNK